MSGPIRIYLAGFAQDGTLGNHADVIALARETDTLGHGGIWFNAFHLNRYSLPCPSLLILGAAKRHLLRRADDRRT